MTKQPQLTLISHKLCPYVQRAVIALEELGVDYRRIDIDLDNPPQWFLRLSPLGKVPLLVIDDDAVLFESAVIAEYINDTHGGGLLSAAPIERARQRAWIEFASAALDNVGALYSAAGEKSYRRALRQLESKWRQLETALGDGPYFSGDSLTLVDAAFGPVFRYLDVFEPLAGNHFLAEFPKVSAWREILRSRESVANAVGRDYPTLLLEFVARRKSYLGELAQDLRRRQFAA